MSSAVRPRRAVRARPRRSRTDRMLSGVCGGLGEQFGVDSMVLRMGFAVLALAGGFGVILYLVLLLVSVEGEQPAARTGGMRTTMAAALVVAGMLLLLRAAGAWFGDGIVWPAALAALGSAIIWTRGGAGQSRLARVAARLSNTPANGWLDGGVSPGRLAVGVLLLAAGAGVFVAAHVSITALAIRNVLLAVGATAAGIALILGPGLARLLRQFGQERAERIRQEERAEVAAHLHDSVLQTLALIQRAASPEEMAVLARGQERELRTWLYGRGGADRGSNTISAALEQAAARIERERRARIELVVVGDALLAEAGVQPLLEATVEAMTNAAAHAGVPLVSVYAEVGPDAIETFVRDEGKGFDPALVPSDRRGIADSIKGRMDRYGGRATVQSAPGEGTEVRLAMPRRTT